MLGPQPVEEPAAAVLLVHGDRHQADEPIFRRPAPHLGEHNDEIYRGMLGTSDADYQRLIDEQHIGWAYLPGLKNGR